MIYTNGCSWTFGSELADVQQAWPYLLGTALGATVDNQAEPGTSNGSIVRRTVRDINEYVRRGLRPTVIIAWTQLHRFELPIGNSHGQYYYNFVSPKDTDVPPVGLEIWQNWSDDVTDRERFELYKQLLGAYLAQNQIEYYFFNTFNSVGPNSFELVTQGLEQGPYRHPLEQAQSKISKHVLTKINS